MSLQETLEKIKPFYTLILVIFIAIIFFCLGRLSYLNSQKTGIEVKYLGNTSSTTTSSLQTATVSSAPTQKIPISEKVVVPVSVQGSGEVIGSKSGKKYYFPWCGTVKRILPQNQVRFSSIEEAKKAGFTPGGNCKGLQ